MPYEVKKCRICDDEVILTTQYTNSIIKLYL